MHHNRQVSVVLPRTSGPSIRDAPFETIRHFIPTSKKQMIARALRVAGRREDKARVVQRSLVRRGHERAGSTTWLSGSSVSKPAAPPPPWLNLTHERPVPCARSQERSIQPMAISLAFLIGSFKTLHRAFKLASRGRTPIALPKIYTGLTDANALGKVCYGQTALDSRVTEIAAQAWFTTQQAGSFSDVRRNSGPYSAGIQATSIAYRFRSTSAQ